MICYEDDKRFWLKRLDIYINKTYKIKKYNIYSIKKVNSMIKSLNKSLEFSVSGNNYPKKTNTFLLYAITLFSILSCKESYLKKDPQIDAYNQVMNDGYISFSKDERSFKERAISEKLKDIISWKKSLPDWIVMKNDSWWIYLSTHFEGYLSYDWVRDVILYINDSLAGIFIYDKSYIKHNFFNNSNLIDSQYIRDKNRDGRELQWTQHTINQFYNTNKINILINWDKEMTDEFDHNIQFWYKILCEDK